MAQKYYIIAQDLPDFYRFTKEIQKKDVPIHAKNTFFVQSDSKNHELLSIKESIAKEMLGIPMVEVVLYNANLKKKVQII